MARRILLLARDMVGDLVNTTGAVAWLKDRYPHDTFVLEGGASATELYPEVEVWTRKRHVGLRGKLQRISRYRKARFDAALVLDDSREKIRTAVLAGIPTVIGVARSSKPLRQARILSFDANAHDLFGTLRKVLSAFSGDDVSEGSIAPALPVGAEHRSQAEVLLDLSTVILHVGASDVPKMWPESRWIELARGLPDAVFAGGRDERPLVDSIASQAGATALPPMDLLTYASVIERARAIVTADTAPAHLAGAVRTSAVVLYGPTDPRRFHPWGDRWIALRHDSGCDHYGSGCAHRLNGACDRTCMNAILVAEVRAALEDRLLS